MLSPKQNTCTSPSRAREISQKREWKAHENQKIRRRAVEYHLQADTALATWSYRNCSWLPWACPQDGVREQSAWRGEVLRGPYCSLQNYRLLMDCGGGMVVDFRCVPNQQWALGSLRVSNYLCSHRESWLNSKGHKTIQKSWLWERALQGGREDVRSGREKRERWE